MAGFAIAKTGSQSRISAMVEGVIEGMSITTQPNHRYLLTTRVYASEVVRRLERYRSSSETLGGEDRAANVRVVLEVHDVDLNDIASVVAPATVLYDGVIANTPAFCSYVLMSADDLHCSLAYTRMLRLSNVMVRSAMPGQPFRTRLVGAMMDGAECNVNFGALQFFSANAPAGNEQIVAEYRHSRRMVAQVTIPKSPGDDGNGARSSMVTVTSPQPRSSDDCAVAAQAILDDRSQQGWLGEYRSWSDFLPADLFPGDMLRMNAPSRDCVAEMIVREVVVDAVDPANDRSWYQIKFANDAAEPVAIAAREVEAAEAAEVVPLDAAVFALEGLPQAQVTDITSTQVTMDMGCEPPAGGGFEVRRSDSGWDPRIERNLVGRFTTRVIAVPRLSRVVSYWVRQYDSANRYSREATLLHVDYPL